MLQNLGGIGNLTSIPAGATVNGLMAFDTGPGNMVIDACMARLYGTACDRGGAVARRGRVLQAVVEAMLRDRYFSAPPPKSCGREEFGDAFVSRFMDRCRSVSTRDADVIATATAFTAASILDAYRRFVKPHGSTAAVSVSRPAKTDYVVAGGGARNVTLMAMLRVGLEPLGVRMRPMEEFGIPAQAKEAVAFALLAWLTWHRLPGNIVAATGSERPMVLGKVTYA